MIFYEAHKIGATASCALFESDIESPRRYNRDTLLLLLFIYLFISRRQNVNIFKENIYIEICIATNGMLIKVKNLRI